MKRRDFIQQLGVSAAVVALPAVVISKPRVYPHIEKDLLRRRSGQKPRFSHVHYCPKCDFSYLCPDRWEHDECGPTREVKRMSQGRDDGVRFQCSACNGQFDKANREAWREANRVDE